MISGVLDGFDQEKLEAVQAVPSLKERYSLESVYANITEKIEGDDLRHKKSNSERYRFFKQPKSSNQEYKICCEKIVSA